MISHTTKRRRTK